MKRNHLFNGLTVLILALASLPLTRYPMVKATPLRHTQISSDTTWSTDRTLSTDVVVQSGATLTIKNITVTANASDAAPYSGGLSPKIEIIVENGGALEVEQGATLTANTAGDWYGIVFLPGSSGSVSGATIEKGIVGVTVHSASLVIITQNRIADMRGVTPALPAGSDGGWAAGVVISGTAATAQVTSNTIESITAGNGVPGLNGNDGAGGASGTAGSSGGDGGHAYGIWVQDGAAATVSNNTIKLVHGGDGANAGKGGNGSGCTLFGDGAWGGNGGFWGGKGGDADGIHVDTAGGTFTYNTIIAILGGNGGHGGDGGAGYAGCNGTSSHPTGGDGGNGGNAGNGGDGGSAIGIYIVDSTLAVQDNNILYDVAIGYNAIAGGAGGNGGTPQNGQSGGTGYRPTGGNGANGGDGGSGGKGGAGGKGGVGGGAMGILVDAYSKNTTPLLIHNSSTGIIIGGAGGDGSAGANGGKGGNGGAGDDNGIGPGGTGGNGGAGGGNGKGGNGGDGGSAVGIYNLSITGFQAAPVLSRNTVARVKGGDAGSADSAGNAGNGGQGGNGGSGAVTGNGGNGGNGGAANGGVGGAGGKGGDSYGLLLFAPGPNLVRNNLVYTLAGGQGTAGGDGGNGGKGGNSGEGTTWGSGGAGGAGGNGGSGGNIGEGKGIAVYTTTYVFNNTINDIVSGGAGVVAGGAAGSGGSGGNGTPSGSVGASGSSGSAGSAGYGYGIYSNLGRPKIVNNIVSCLPDGKSNSTIEYGIYSVVNIPGVDIDRDFNDVYNWDNNYYQAPAGAHDIHQDPLFVDRLNGDHHLKSNSPCIDAGDDGTASGMGLPTEDIELDIRPAGPKHDIGADEFVPVPPSGMTIAGPTQGEVKTGYLFVATVAPASATTPLTYTWQATNQTTVSRTGGISASLTLTWTTMGRQTITVTIANASGQAIKTRVITISHKIYLPLAIRNH